MQEPSKAENARGWKFKVGIVGTLLLLLACISWLDVKGSLILLMIPMPVGAEDDNLFFGGIDSRGAFRHFVVYLNYTHIKEFYETELRKGGWSVETKSSTFSTGSMFCLKIEKPPFFNAFVEIYGNTNSNRTKVYIKPPSRYSPCQSEF